MTHHLPALLALAAAAAILWAAIVAADKARRALRRRRSRRRFTRKLRRTLLLGDLQDAMGRVQPPLSDTERAALEHARDESRWSA